jgi:hypothetical protein
LYADAAIDPPALASKTCHQNATAKPVVLAPLEVPAKASFSAMRSSCDIAYSDSPAVFEGVLEAPGVTKFAFADFPLAKAVAQDELLVELISGSRGGCAATRIFLASFLRKKVARGALFK